MRRLRITAATPAHPASSKRLAIGVIVSKPPMVPRVLRSFYPEIQPYRTGYLQVSPAHALYFEESGNPAGKPAVFLHGGPGGGTSANQRRFFDPARYRVVLFDQRG